MTVPFRPGFDPRRGKGPPPRSATGPTLRSLARADRSANLKALKSIRDDVVALVHQAREAGGIPKGLGDVARVGVEASKVLALYSDGEPGIHNVPTDADEKSSESGELAQVLELLRQGAPGEAPPTPQAPGGDAGSPGEGGGGEA